MIDYEVRIGRTGFSLSRGGYDDGESRQAEARPTQIPDGKA
jgi:hypothetical protein